MYTPGRAAFLLATAPATDRAACARIVAAQPSLFRAAESFEGCFGERDASVRGVRHALVFGEVDDLPGGG